MEKARASVQTALDLLQEEMGKLIEVAREEGAEAYRDGDTKTFEQIDRQRPDLQAFGAQVETLAKQWRTIGRQPARRSRRTTTQPKAPRPRDILHEREYVLPILQVLHDAGGSARVSDTKPELARILRSRLGPHDHSPLKTGEIRWINRAHWARRYMVLAGMLASNSPRGTWEITPKGEALLRSGDVEGAWATLAAVKQPRNAR